jgi:SnoaL-like protein
MTIETLLDHYFAAIHSGGWENFIAEDFTFVNNNLDHVMHGKEAYIKGAGQFFRATTSVERRQQFISGNEIAVLARYTIRSPKGDPGYCDVAEFIKVDDDKLIESTIIFDLKAFNEFMQG